MRPDLWLAFVAATMVIGFVPGPGVAAIVGYAIGSGRRTAFASVAGLASGNFVAAVASLIGVGALLAASALAFGIVKWAGAGYLIGVGLLTIWKARGAGPLTVAATPAVAPRTAFLANIAIGAFHPKTILFLAAFAPQFMDPTRAYAPQAAILAATFCLTLAATDFLYAWLASGTRSLFASPKALRWSQRAGGGALIFAGLAAASIRR
ncbi:LysE family translocator [Sphingomonas mollis]|uniref:LysE family translocator n=1 Tax=Sphingomonas mollis TaxID=2795726 RepID=A0ABS0XJP8_9SPHN|nr:LysE family translocator [Sphingomonas sp. BT553]MBJ6120256.1 LysE family translocator [Sphingomonas sp. BT553]